MLSSGFSDPYCLLGLMRRTDETATRLAEGSAEECSTVLSPVALMASIIGDVRFFNVSRTAVRNRSGTRNARIPNCLFLEKNYSKFEKARKIHRNTIKFAPKMEQSPGIDCWTPTFFQTFIGCVNFLNILIFLVKFSFLEII